MDKDLLISKYIEFATRVLHGFQNNNATASIIGGTNRSKFLNAIYYKFKVEVNSLRDTFILAEIIHKNHKIDLLPWKQNEYLYIDSTDWEALSKRILWPLLAYQNNLQNDISLLNEVLPKYFDYWGKNFWPYNVSGELDNFACDLDQFVINDFKVAKTGRNIWQLLYIPTISTQDEWDIFYENLKYFIAAIRSIKNASFIGAGRLVYIQSANELCCINDLEHFIIDKYLCTSNGTIECEITSTDIEQIKANYLALNEHKLGIIEEYNKICSMRTKANAIMHIIRCYEYLVHPDKDRKKSVKQLIKSNSSADKQAELDDMYEFGKAVRNCLEHDPNHNTFFKAVTEVVRVILLLQSQGEITSRETSIFRSPALRNQIMKQEQFKGNVTFVSLNFCEYLFEHITSVLLKL